MEEQERKKLIQTQAMIFDKMQRQVKRGKGFSMNDARATESTHHTSDHGQTDLKWIKTYM